MILPKMDTGDNHENQSKSLILTLVCINCINKIFPDPDLKFSLSVRK